MLDNSSKDTKSIFDLMQEPASKSLVTHDDYVSTDRNNWESRKKKDAMDELFLLRHHRDIQLDEIEQAISEQNMGFRERSRLRYKFTRDAMIATFAIWFGALIFAGIFSYLQYKEALVTLAPHTVAMADVTYMYTSRCGKNNSSTCYNVRVDFTANGQHYSVSDSVSYELYQKASLEHRITVTYNNDDPNVLEVGEPEWGLNDTLIVLAIALGLAALLGYTVRNFMRARQLQTQGQLIIGEVTKSLGTNYKGTHTVKVSYVFTTPEGRQLTGSQSQARNDLKGLPFPHSGQSVVVVYFNDKLHKIL